MVNCIYNVRTVLSLDELMNENLISIYNTNSKNEFLYVYEIGTQNCLPNKPSRTHVFECTTLHFVVDGEGFVDGQLVKPGEGFMVREGEIVTYKSNPDNPWTYYWINITGDAVALLLEKIGIEETKCVFEYSKINEIKQVFENGLNLDYSNNEKGMMFLSMLFEIMSILEIEYKNSQKVKNKVSVSEEHYRNALCFMANNYFKKISINDVARFENVERHYLDRLFMQHSGKSPMKHLLEIRMERAGILLRTTNYSVGVISSSVGYTDQLQFSKAFKKYMGISPSEYRENENFERHDNEFK